MLNTRAISSLCACDLGFVSLRVRHVGLRTCRGKVSRVGSSQAGTAMARKMPHIQCGAHRVKRSAKCGWMRARPLMERERCSQWNQGCHWRAKNAHECGANREKCKVRGGKGSTTHQDVDKDGAQNAVPPAVARPKAQDACTTATGCVTAVHPCPA